MACFVIKNELFLENYIFSLLLFSLIKQTKIGIYKEKFTKIILLYYYIYLHKNNKMF